jgi:hypothetical protein
LPLNWQTVAKLEEAIMEEEDRQRKARELQAHAVAGDSAVQAARDKLDAGWSMVMVG